MLPDDYPGGQPTIVPVPPQGDCVFMTDSLSRPRLREFGIFPGELEPGPRNAITDVAGVRVGQTTVWWGDGPLRPGHGPARTGVTVVLPHGGNLFQEKVPAAFHVINGFGKSIGGDQITELGSIETPIALTSTLAVGRVAVADEKDAVAECMVGPETSLWFTRLRLSLPSVFIDQIW